MPWTSNLNNSLLTCRVWASGYSRGGVAGQLGSRQARKVFPGGPISKGVMHLLIPVS